MARKLATARRIDEILVHPNADSLEIAVLGGWNVIVKKEEYSANQAVIFCEIDSWMPTSIAGFLTKPEKEPKEYKGVKGERLRTVRLRGELSQGLILPLSTLDFYKGDIAEGDDVTELLGIIQWEPPENAVNMGLARGNFPSHLVPKTDQNRLQNLSREFEKWKECEEVWEVTEKAEGSSMTVIKYEDEFHVCSRNLSLKESEDGTFWKTALQYDIRNKLCALGRNIAIQGELIGPGIQGNIYKLDSHKWLVFDVFDIDEQKYLSSDARQDLVEHLELEHIPVVHQSIPIRADATLHEMLSYADGGTNIGNAPKQLREGLVWKSINNPSLSFKTVSNLYLSKEK